MITLLRGLHSIAAQRGDGLRPEFLTMTSASTSPAKIEEIEGASRAQREQVIHGADAKVLDASTNVVPLPIPKG